MSKRKDSRIKATRAGTFPKCYGECGCCAERCEYYAEWKADQYAAAVAEEVSRQQAKWANYG